MPRVRWDVEDFEDFEDEEDFQRFEKIKPSQRKELNEDGTMKSAYKKKPSVKHQPRPDKS
jgi:hypothetical protein